MKLFSQKGKFILFVMIFSCSINLVTNQLFDFIQLSEKKSDSLSVFDSLSKNNQEEHKLSVKVALNNTLRESTFQEVPIYAPVNKPLVKNDPRPATDNIQHIINKNKHVLTELEKKEKERIKSQDKELATMQRKFKLINLKTKKLEKLLSENNSLKELGDLKNQLKNNKAMSDKYIKKFSEVNESIISLTKEIEQLSEELNKHEKENRIEEIISNTPVEKVQATNNLEVDGSLKVENLLTSELRLGTSKFSEDMIEVENNFIINIKGSKYDVKSLLYYNYMMNAFRENCGDNLSCLITNEDYTKRAETEDMMEKTMKSIKFHLQSMNIKK